MTEQQMQSSSLRVWRSVSPRVFSVLVVFLTIFVMVPLDKGFIDGLQQLDHNKLTVVWTHVANLANISTVAFKKTRIELPSFSVAKWSNFA
jgi:hypothetical protein